MTNLEREVRDYFNRCFSDDPDILKEYNPKTLTFSFIMGMHPNECEYMEVEEEVFTPEQIREYEEIESIINRIKREAYK